MNHETTGAKRRPSLLAGERRAADESREPDSGPVSILSSIDASPRTPRKRRASAAAKPPRSRSWSIAVLGIAAVALAVAGLVYVDEQGLGSWASSEPASPATEATASVSAPVATHDVSVAAAPAPVPALEASAPQTAVIETVVAAPQSEKADPFSSLAPGTATGQAPVAAAAAAAAAPQASPAKRTAAKAPAAASVKPTRASAPAKRAVSPSQRRDTRLAKAASPQKDPDVDLIEALVSHVAGKEAAAARRDPGRRLADAKPQGAGATREVVLQQEPALPTGELVRRCMTLGWLESQLCRARICSGQWGQDAACPTAQQQNAEFRR